MPKRWRIRPHDPDGIARLGREAGVSSVVAQLLICRGICDPSAAKEFLDPKISGLRDPELLPGLTAAADRIHAAVAAGKQITVYGDYDADGMTATAILLGCLQLHGGEGRFLRAPSHRRRLRPERRSAAHAGPARQPDGDHRRLRHRQRERSPHRAGTRPGTDHHRSSRNGRRIARRRRDRSSAPARPQLSVRRTERRRRGVQTGLGTLPARLPGEESDRSDAVVPAAGHRHRSRWHGGRRRAAGR